MPDSKKYTLIFLFILLFTPAILHAQPESHLVISEVSAGVNNAKNEFIELYNPTLFSINLKSSNIILKLVSSAGKATAKDITWTNEIIQPNGFFLFGTGDVGIPFDATYSSGSITGVGGAIISDKDGAVIDKVAWGEKPPRLKIPPALASETQGIEIDQLGGMSTDQSIERKAKESSTAESMTTDEDKSAGNSWDSDNNSQDFILQAIPVPQNYSSQEKPALKKDSDSPAPSPAPTPPTEPKIYPKEIRINELLPDPKGNDKELEFIELENYSEVETDITGWSIQDAKSNDNQEETTHKFIFTPQYCVARIDLCKIQAGKFFTVYGKDYAPIALNNTNGDTIRLLDPENIAVNTVFYAKKKVKEDYAYAFDGQNWQWTLISTPNQKNQFNSITQNDTQSNKSVSYSSAIRLNEILPNAAEEYMELYNNDMQAVNLSGWILRDASKQGKHIFPENTSILAKGFLVITKKEFNFALNNSGEESVFLYNPREELASWLSYTGSKRDISYNFDGEIWRWSPLLTPGQENRFPEPLQIKIKMPEHVYRGIPAFFKVSFDTSSSEKIKISWDFGDGHKSYQASTRHTYKNTGVYEISVKVSAEENYLETFFVTAEDFPEIKVKISSFSPNPKGADTKLEWIEIENNSKRKVNLQDWSIATGWDRMVNHPIKKDFIIKSGESKRLTRKFSNFTLNNKKSKIELRYPDGEIAHSVKYKSAKSIADDAVYQKSKNKKKWEQFAPEEIEEKEADSAELVISSESISSDAPEQPEAPISENNLPDLVAINLKNPPPAEISGYSQSPEWREKKERLISLIDNKTTQIAPTKTRLEIINNLLSIKTVRAQNENYLFNEASSQKHYAVRFMNNLERDINYWLGKVVKMIL